MEKDYYSMKSKQLRAFQQMQKRETSTREQYSGGSGRYYSKDKNVAYFRCGKCEKKWYRTENNFIGRCEQCVVCKISIQPYKIKKVVDVIWAVNSLFKCEKCKNKKAWDSYSLLPLKCRYCKRFCYPHKPVLVNRSRIRNEDKKKMMRRYDRVIRKNGDFPSNEGDGFLKSIVESVGWSWTEFKTNAREEARAKARMKYSRTHSVYEDDDDDDEYRTGFELDMDDYSDDEQELMNLQEQEMLIEQQQEQQRFDDFNVFSFDMEHLAPSEKETDTGISKSIDSQIQRLENLRSTNKPKSPEDFFLQPIESPLDTSPNPVLEKKIENVVNSLFGILERMKKIKSRNDELNEELKKKKKEDDAIFMDFQTFQNSTSTSPKKKINQSLDFNLSFLDEKSSPQSVKKKKKKKMNQSPVKKKKKKKPNYDNVRPSTCSTSKIVKVRSPKVSWKKCKKKKKKKREIPFVYEKIDEEKRKHFRRYIDTQNKTTTSEDNSFQIYCKGIPSGCDIDEIYKYFSKTAGVKSIELINHLDYANGAFITFMEESQRDKTLLLLQGTKFMDCEIMLKIPEKMEKKGRGGNSGLQKMKKFTFTNFNL